MLPVVKHTYAFVYEGRTFQRTTARLYTHALVVWLDSRYVPGGTPGEIEPCAPYIADVAYGWSREHVLQALRPWHCRADIVELAQPRKARRSA